MARILKVKSNRQTRSLDRGPEIPARLDSERSILGAILLDPSLYEVVVLLRTAEYFFLDSNVVIFRYMGELRMSGQDIRLDTLVAVLEKNGRLQAVGGAEYVAGLIDGVIPDRRSIEIHAENVHEIHLQHQLYKLGESLMTRTDRPGEVLADLRRTCSRLTIEAETTARIRRLRSLALDPGFLVAELEQFFAERAWLPNGSALLLALWAMNTWVFDVFDTTPYLLLESAVPGCGKTTVLRLIGAVSRSTAAAVSASEAALFRMVESMHPTLLVDEGESLAGRTHRNEGLRAILNAGYKSGSKVPRCVGEGKSIDVAYFDTFCPKVIAAIGGLRGSLLDRCIVLTMRKLPPGTHVKSSNQKRVNLAAKPLVEKLEAYALHTRDDLARMYENEPESGYWQELRGRETELWAPLLYHARCAGPETERRALDTALYYSGAKLRLQSENKYFELAREILEALRSFSAERFSPGELLSTLNEFEEWGETLAGKRDEKERAACIGRFIGNFRLGSRQRPHGKTTYRTDEAIEKISGCLPGSLAVTAASATSAATGANTPLPNAADRVQTPPWEHAASAASEKADTEVAETRVTTSSAAGTADAAVEQVLVPTFQGILRGEL